MNCESDRQKESIFMGREQRRGNFDRFSNKNVKSKTKISYRDKVNNRSLQEDGYESTTHPIKSKIEPKNENQRLLISAIKANIATFATGPAGTGKTFLAIVVACGLLKIGIIKQIILTKPAFEIDEDLGTLPGDKDEKMMVLTKPMRDVFIKIIGSSHFENLVRSEKICFEPLGSILGCTFDDAFIIIDESQNSTPSQMKALLTRTGLRSKIVICGDAFEQKFIEGQSGLEDALLRLCHLPNVGHVNFTVDDIVRSGFTKDVILAYRRDLSEPL